MENSLILTVLLDKNSQEYFDILRSKHFPKEINYLNAHLTLFHKLTASHNVLETIESFSANQKVFQMNVISVSSIGNGVAFKIESPELQAIHAALQTAFVDFLIPQDKQKLWPHITIQNKVPPAVAKALKEKIEKDFRPFPVIAEGLVLWEYLNGPWKLYKIFYFN